MTDKRKAALEALDMAENHPARMSDGRGELNIPPYYEQWVGENLKPHLKTIRAALTAPPPAEKSADLVEALKWVQKRAEGYHNEILNKEREAQLTPLAKKRIWAGIRACETIRAALQSQGWQEIGSAPRDGTAVDLWLGNAEFPRRETDCVFREFTESEWLTHHLDDEHGEDNKKHWFDNGFRGYPFIGDDLPTHWQPLPPPPKVIK